MTWPLMTAPSRLRGFARDIQAPACLLANIGETMSKALVSSAVAQMKSSILASSSSQEIRPDPIDRAVQL